MRPLTTFISTAIQCRSVRPQSPADVGGSASPHHPRRNGRPGAFANCAFYFNQMDQPAPLQPLEGRSLLLSLWENLLAGLGVRDDDCDRGQASAALMIRSAGPSPVTRSLFVELEYPRRDVDAVPVGACRPAHDLHK